MHTWRSSGEKLRYARTVHFSTVLLRFSCLPTGRRFSSQSTLKYATYVRTTTLVVTNNKQNGLPVWLGSPFWYLSRYKPGSVSYFFTNKGQPSI